MKTLVAPLNWGLGHASRCVALVRRLIEAGDEVVLGGDGDSLLLLRQHFPELKVVELASLELRYSRGNSQVWALVRSIPKVLRWVIRDHRMLREIQREEQFDRIVSDNRFGCWLESDDNENGKVKTVYMTHQVKICMPKGWRWAEKIATRVHAYVYNKYKELWIPDYDDEERSLAGQLSHGAECKVRYIGPLSRFESFNLGRIEDDKPRYDVVAVLSGLEPQRTMLEEELIRAQRASGEKMLIVRGKVGYDDNETVNQGEHSPNLVMVNNMCDEALVQVMLGAKRIIARSGYSTIMDMYVLGILDKAELIPTPGQSEQEYLAAWLGVRRKTINNNI